MKVNANNILFLLREAEESGSYPGWARGVLELHGINSALWELEDRAREREISDADLAAVKREIDQRNLLRHKAIAELDVLIYEDLYAEPPKKEAEQIFNSETPAQMTDRLSVLILKEILLRSEDDADSLMRVSARIKFIASCQDQVFMKARKGARLVLFKEYKKYGR